MSGRRRKILVLRLSALGDVAMTVPVIYSVARQYADVDFTVVTRPFFRRLFINAPANVSFSDFEAKSFGELLKFTKRLRGEGFDAVADLHDVMRTRLIAAGVSAFSHTRSATVNKNRSGRKELTANKSREYQRNYIDRYADVFAALGLPLAGIGDPGINRGGERRGVGIAPFARYATKAYPAELMEQVARRLAADGIEVSLFGARGAEQEQLQQWVDRTPALKLMAGKLSLEQELEAMGKLQVMVTMDSANMHLASLVGTPVVSIWGSTIPQCGFLGFGQQRGDCLWVDLPCQPCSVAGLAECPLHNGIKCLRELDPDVVYEKIKSKL